MHIPGANVNPDPAIDRVREREAAGRIPPDVAARLRAAIEEAAAAGWSFDIVDRDRDAGALPAATLPAIEPGSTLVASDTRVVPVPTRMASRPTGFLHVRVLGAGGFGDVALARDPQLDRPVAIKTLHPHLAAAQRERFLREARITAQLEHPGIIPVHQLYHRDDGNWVLVMKYIDGLTLDRWATQQPPPDLTQRIEVFSRVCDSMAFAHSRGVIHRDLKPSNVMVGEFGEVLVLDWGLARTRDSQADNGTPTAAHAGIDATLDGTVVGTPAWMPPEQARGDLDMVDERSDVYSLGAVLYFLLCGHAPFDGDNAIDVLRRVRAGNPPLPSTRTDRPVPSGLEQIAMRALAPERADRFPSVHDLQHAARHGAHVGMLQSDLRLTSPAPPLESAIYAVQRFAWLVSHATVVFHRERGEIDEAATVNLVRMMSGAGDKGIAADAFSRMIVWHDHPEQLVERLVEIGLAERRDDGDGPRWVATDAGAVLAQGNREYMRRLFDTWTHGLSDNELAHLAEMVTRLRDCVDVDAPVPPGMEDIPRWSKQEPRP
ncbi:MAG: protein kinase [Planctomycetota bacterium]